MLLLGGGVLLATRPHLLVVVVARLAAWLPRYASWAATQMTEQAARARFGGTKAQQMAGIMADLGRDTAIALGDAPNDTEMLETADYGVIIRNDHGQGIPALPGETTCTIIRSEAPGPAGWNASVLSLLDRLGYSKRADRHG